MTRKRAIASTFVLVLVSVLIDAAVAHAEFRGTDMWSSIMPGGGEDGLVNRYPLSHYQLDYYVDTVSIGLNGPDASGVPASVAQFMASFLFFIGAILMRCVIAVFDWSSNIDMLTGDNGALSLAAPIVQDNYRMIVAPFMTVAIICMGVWILVKVKQHKHNDLGSSLVRVVVLSAVAFAIVNHPNDTIGRLFQMGDDLSQAIISGGSNKSASDLMFETFVYRPHAVLQHGGLEVCTGAKHDDDGFPLAATVQNPAQTCHSVLRRDADGHGNYEAIMLRYAPGSEQRKDYYDALREGVEFSGAPTANIDKTDAPAVDMMQAGGALQRLVFVIAILAGMAGGILLLGLIVVARLFSQIALMMLYFASSFVILAAAYPGAHGLASKYLKLVGFALVSSAVFAILLSITLNTSRGMIAVATTVDPAKGFGVAFSLQALLFLGVFWKRKAILAAATTSKIAERASESEHKVVSFVANATTTSFGAMAGGFGAVASGVSGFAGTMREGWKQGHGGSSSNQPAPPAPASQPAPAGPTSQPASAGHGHSNSGDVPSTTSATIPPTAPDGAPTEEDQMPTKTFREELNDVRARRYDQEQFDSADESTMSEVGERAAARAPGPPYFHTMDGAGSDPVERPAGIASASTFAQELEEARRERELEQRE